MAIRGIRKDEILITGENREEADKVGGMNNRQEEEVDQHIIFHGGN